MRPDGRPAVCLVTDRRRLAAKLGVPEEGASELLLRQIAGAIAGGIDVIQIRERDLEGGVLVDLVRRCLALAAGTPTRIVVNDRLDVAIAAASNGVHLREDSVPPRAARDLAGPEFLIGRSIHRPVAGDDPSHLSAVDYLLAGTLFPTGSKPGLRAPLGIEGLREVVASADPGIVWAIGGVMAAHLPAIAAAGARGAAAVGAFQPSVAPRDLETAVAESAQEWRFSFDRLGRPT